MKTYTYTITPFNPQQFHDMLTANGFAGSYICYTGEPTNQLTVYCPDAETKTPDALVAAYVYTPRIVYDWKALLATPLQQWQTAVTDYATAQGQYTAAGTTASKFAAQQAEIAALKSGTLALRDALKVLAQSRELEDAPKY